MKNQVVCSICGKHFDEEFSPIENTEICFKCGVKLEEINILKARIQKLEEDIVNNADYTIGLRRYYKRRLKNLKTSLKQLLDE